MSTYGDNPEVHAIRDGRFVCTAPDDAPCRTTPTCECEQWCCCDGSPEDAADNHDLNDGEHCCMTSKAPGGDCWIEPWINATYLEDSFGGDGKAALEVMVRVDEEEGELAWPDGPVACDWEGDFVSWTYADGADA